MANNDFVIRTCRLVLQFLNLDTSLLTVWSFVNKIYWICLEILIFMFFFFIRQLIFFYRNVAT